MGPIATMMVHSLTTHLLAGLVGAACGVTLEAWRQQLDRRAGERRP